jgi:hypothetical protein
MRGAVLLLVAVCAGVVRGDESANEDALVYVQPQGVSVLRQSATDGHMSANAARAAVHSLLGLPSHPLTDDSASRETDALLHPHALMEAHPVVHLTIRGAGSGSLALPNGVEMILDDAADPVEEAVSSHAPTSSDSRVTELACDSSNFPPKGEIEAALSFDQAAVQQLQSKADGFLAELACLLRSSSLERANSQEVASFIRAEINGLESVRGNLSEVQLESARRLLRGAVERVLEGVQSRTGKAPLGHVLATRHKRGCAQSTSPSARTVLQDSSGDSGNSSSSSGGGERKIADPRDFQLNAIAYSIGLVLLATTIGAVYCLFNATFSYDSLVLASRIPETKLE